MNSRTDHVPLRTQTSVLHGITSCLLSLLGPISGRCHLPKKIKKRSPKHPTSNVKKSRSMDVASFREISRIQRLENEMLKALKASSRNDNQTKEIWSGFGQRHQKWKLKKKRKPLGVIQSKARVKGQVAKAVENNNIPIARLLDIQDSNS